MKEELYRNDDHFIAIDELHHRYYYLTDQIREHEDERLLQRNIRRHIEVPTHGDRGKGPNEHWVISSYTGQWLMTHNGRSVTCKAHRDYWTSILRRWQVLLAIGAALLTVANILLPDFRSLLWSLFKEHILSHFIGAP